jgi:hypothetical protein
MDDKIFDNIISNAFNGTCTNTTNDTPSGEDIFRCIENAIYQIEGKQKASWIRVLGKLRMSEQSILEMEEYDTIILPINMEYAREFFSQHGKNVLTSAYIEKGDMLCINSKAIFGIDNIGIDKSIEGDK